MAKKIAAVALGERVKQRRTTLGISQAKLAEEVTRLGINLSQQNVNSIESGHVTRPRALPELATVLQSPLEWLRDGRGPEVLTPDPRLDFQEATSLPSSEHHVTIPIEDQQSFLGQFVLAGGLRRERIGRAIFMAPFTLAMHGSTMSPAIESGNVLTVDPMRPVIKNTECIFLQEEEEGGHMALVARLLDASSETWRVRQFAPAKDFNLPRKTWRYAFQITSISRIPTR